MIGTGSMTGTWTAWPDTEEQLRWIMNYEAQL
jgi:hypothetical protein